MEKHPLWGVDTSRWSWRRHAFAWSVFVPMALGVGWLANTLIPPIVRAILS